jgi:hypothetical protein
MATHETASGHTAPAPAGRRCSGAAMTEERRRCRCHDQPMDRNTSSKGGWTCAVKRRARQLAAYHADPASANYARWRRSLRARIERKRERIAELSDELLKVER